MATAAVTAATGVAAASSSVALLPKQPVVTSHKVSNRDKKLFPGIKLNTLVMCEDLLINVGSMKDELEKTKNFQIVDEHITILTRTIMEMREVLDPWPSRKLEQGPPTPPPIHNTTAGGAATSGGEFNLLVSHLSLHLWDIQARIEAIQHWCLNSENLDYLMDMFTDIRHLRWLTGAYELSAQIIGKNLSAQTIDETREREGEDKSEGKKNKKDKKNDKKKDKTNKSKTSKSQQEVERTNKKSLFLTNRKKTATPRPEKQETKKM